MEDNFICKINPHWVMECHYDSNLKHSPQMKNMWELKTDKNTDVFSGMKKVWNTVMKHNKKRQGSKVKNCNLQRFPWTLSVESNGLKSRHLSCLHPIFNQHVHDYAPVSMRCELSQLAVRVCVQIAFFSGCQHLFPIVPNEERAPREKVLHPLAPGSLCAATPSAFS